MFKFNCFPHLHICPCIIGMRFIVKPVEKNILVTVL